MIFISEHQCNNGGIVLDYVSILTFFTGYIIAEIIRRMNRAENFNAQIFNKRLDVFSELYATWNRTYKDISDFIESIISQTISEDTDLFEVQFILVKPLLQLLDEKALFFSQELIVQCGAAFLAPDDYSVETCQKYLEHIREQNKLIAGMIRDEAGLTMLNKNIKGIIRYNHKSDLITYLKKCK